MYVVDQNKYILFHPDMNKIGQLSNINIQSLARKNRGEIRLTDEYGNEWLAGFARIPTTGWMVISQQPASELLKETSDTVYEMLVGMLLFYILIFFIIWKISYLISGPLSLLANMASHLHKPDIEASIERVNPWFVEVRQFKSALLISSQHFKDTISKLKFICTPIHSLIYIIGVVWDCLWLILLKQTFRLQSSQLISIILRKLMIGLGMTKVT
jgi:hypothetical protein